MPEWIAFHDSMTVNTRKNSFLVKTSTLLDSTETQQRGKIVQFDNEIYFIRGKINLRHSTKFSRREKNVKFPKFPYCHVGVLWKRRNRNAFSRAFSLGCDMEERNIQFDEKFMYAVNGFSHLTNREERRWRREKGEKNCRMLNQAKRKVRWNSNGNGRSKSEAWVCSLKLEGLLDHCLTLNNWCGKFIEGWRTRTSVITLFRL